MTVWPARFCSAQISHAISWVPRGMAGWVDAWVLFQTRSSNQQGDLPPRWMNTGSAKVMRANALASSIAENAWMVQRFQIWSPMNAVSAGFQNQSKLCSYRRQLPSCSTIRVAALTSRQNKVVIKNNKNENRAFTHLDLHMIRPENIIDLFFFTSIQRQPKKIAKTLWSSWWCCDRAGCFIRILIYFIYHFIIGALSDGISRVSSTSEPPLPLDWLLMIQSSIWLIDIGLIVHDGATWRKLLFARY